MKVRGEDDLAKKSEEKESGRINIGREKSEKNP